MKKTKFGSKVEGAFHGQGRKLRERKRGRERITCFSLTSNFAREWSERERERERETHAWWCSLKISVSFTLLSNFADFIKNG